MTTNTTPHSVPSQPGPTLLGTPPIAMTIFSSSGPQPSLPADGSPQNAAAGRPPPNITAMMKRTYSGIFGWTRKAIKLLWKIRMHQLASVLVLVPLMLTVYYDGKKRMSMAAIEDDIVWNWPLLSFWAEEAAWYVVSHCIRLHWALVYADANSNPLPPTTYLILVVVWSILHLLLHPLFISAETPAHAHDLFILNTPPIITVGILLCSASRFSLRDSTRPGDLESQIGNMSVSDGQTSGASAG